MESPMEKTSDLIKMYDEYTGARKFVRRRKGPIRQLEIIEDTLVKLGLSRNEGRVYLYLARVGEKKASKISEALSIHRTETYRILHDLEKKGLVSSVFGKPLKFIAKSLEKTIDLLIEAKRMKIKLLEKEKDDLVELWQSLPKPKVEEAHKEIFQILEGEGQIVLKANELLDRAETEIQIFAPGEDLAYLYHSDFTDKLERFSTKLKITLLTENSSKSKFFLERIDRAKLNYGIVDVDNLPCFIVSDNKELLTIIREKNEEKNRIRKTKSKVVALWTNYTAFVRTLQILFFKLRETGKTIREIYVKG
jgi:sugar-specific transcriptional regulator TrmB